MEPSVQEMRETSVTLQHLADEHVQARRGRRSVDVANRERAVNLLQQFQQTYPSNHAFKIMTSARDSLGGCLSRSR
jgi:hypothetical protein